MLIKELQKIAVLDNEKYLMDYCDGWLSREDISVLSPYQRKQLVQLLIPINKRRTNNILTDLFHKDRDLYKRMIKAFDEEPSINVKWLEVEHDA